MSQATMAAPVVSERSGTPKTRRSVLVRAARTSTGGIGLGIMATVIAIAVVGPHLAPHTSTEIVSLPYSTDVGIFGADKVGRDVLSRLLHGGQALVMLSVLATAAGVVVGSILGLSAAYFGGKVDSIGMRVCDVFLAFPQLVLVMLAVNAFGSSYPLLIGAVAITQAPSLARVMRSAAMEVCERDFVRAVQLWKPSAFRVITTEVLPNVTTPFMVEVGFKLTHAVMVISSLSFLGLGIRASEANWGLMISENRLGITANPWAVAAPAIVIGALTVGVNMFADSISRVGLKEETGGAA